jgi:prophage maintenance system killer protein
MTPLTVDMILEIHGDVIAQDGGDSRVLSEANVHQMVFLANSIPDVYRRAAFALYSLCAYPPFCEGNERTARIVVERILLECDLYFAPDDDCITLLIAGISAYTMEPEDIERVLREHAQ